jgi:hypothetical protein
MALLGRLNADGVSFRTTVMQDENFESLRWASQPLMAAAGIEDDWPRLEPRVIR